MNNTDTPEIRYMSFKLHRQNFSNFFFLLLIPVPWKGTRFTAPEKQLLPSECVIISFMDYVTGTDNL